MLDIEKRADGGRGRGLIAEYLFIDEERLNSYFEQVSSPIKYEKVATLGIELSLTGPKATGTQSRPSRPFTTHEKIQTVFDNVPIFRLQGAEEEDRGEPFQFATFRGFRAFIPPKANKAETFKGLAIWVCKLVEDDSETFDFYLIEDLPGGERAPQGWSGRSALWMLFDEVGEQVINETAISLDVSEPSDAEKIKIMARHGAFDEIRSSSTLGMMEMIRQEMKTAGMKVSDVLSEGGFSNFGTRLSYELRDGALRYKCEVIRPRTNDPADPTLIALTRDRAMESAGRFASDPISLLAEWGAEVGPIQEFDALYRVRHTLIEDSMPDHHFKLIGYPIFIAEHPSPFSERSRRNS